MTPIPIDPTVVVRVDASGNVVSVANNIDTNLKVVVVNSDDEFKAEACNKPFDTTQSYAQTN